MLFWPWTDTSKKIEDNLNNSLNSSFNTCECEGGCSVNKWMRLRWYCLRSILKFTWFIYNICQFIFPKFKLGKTSTKEIRTAIDTKVDLSDVIPHLDEIYKNSELERNRIFSELKKDNIDLTFLNDNIKS